MNLIGNIFNFIVNLAVILGGLVCVAWLAGSLLVYSQLGRPVWELAILVGVSLFVFTWFCVWVIRRRPPRDRTRKPSEDDSWGETREELEDYLAEIEEALSEARREGKKEEVKGLEEAREDILGQIEGRQLEGKVEKLHRLRKEARKAGRKEEAEKYSKQIDKHEAKLKERGDRIEDLPLHLKLFVYFMLGGIVACIAFLILMIPMVMLGVTWEFWNEWTGGSEWMRSPGVMIAVIFGCLGLACVAAQVVSWYFSPDESETKKKKSAGKKRRGKEGKDTEDSLEKIGTDPSPPPLPGEETPPGAPPPG